MIPKIIHYAWFGGEKSKPEILYKCIESWKKYCPDYQIVEWNETNFDLTCSDYCMAAYNSKKYAFVSDYLRNWVLVHFGGIYFDVDVELIRNIDDLLINKAFVACEANYYVATGLGCGGEPGHPFWITILHMYEKLSFYDQNGDLNLTTCPVYVTRVLKEWGMKKTNEIQTVKSVTIYPEEFFAPGDFWIQTPMITENTYAIHHYLASWIPDRLKRRREEYRNQYRCIFLSPHYDDAIGSCGGWISTLIQNDINVEIWTVFGGVYNGNDSPLSAIIHAKWGSNDRNIRCEEDVKACGVLNCQYVHMNYFDCIYRKDSNGSFLYPKPGKEFGQVTKNDIQLIDEIIQEIIPKIRLTDDIYAPMSIGHHVDHVIVHEVAKKIRNLGYKVKYYKDFSYQDKFIHHQPYRTIKLSSLQKKNKKKALTMYESQIKVLFSSKSILDQWIESEGSIETYYEST